MSGKYYAIRRGVQTGIFTDWDSCKTFVVGYPGAEFQKFSTEEDAKYYLDGNDFGYRGEAKISVPVDEDSCNMYSWAIYNPNGTLEFSVVVENSHSHLNRFHGYTLPHDYISANGSSARTIGVLAGLYICYQLGYKNVTVVCNDVCLEKWATGEYKAKGVMQSKYVSLLEEIVRVGLGIDFAVLSKCQLLSVAKKLAKGGYISGNAIDFIELINNEFSCKSLCVI